MESNEPNGTTEPTTEQPTHQPIPNSNSNDNYFKNKQNSNWSNLKHLFCFDCKII